MSASSQSPTILLVTEKRDLAADHLVLALRELDAAFCRLNCDDFPARVSASWEAPVGNGSFVVGEQVVRMSDVQSAWFRRPAVPRLPSDICEGDTAQFIRSQSLGMLTGLWASSHWLWVNDPSRVAVAESKLLQLRLAHLAGLTIPATLVSNCPEDVRAFAGRHKAIIGKPLNGSMLLPANDADDYALFTQPLARCDLDDDRAIASAPCIFQARIERALDIRVTIAGEQCFACEIALEAGDAASVDWRAVPEERIAYREHVLPTHIQDRCERLLARLGLLFGAFDFLLTPAGEYIFLEVNPSGQWAWIERATGQPITLALVQLLASRHAG